ACDRLDPDGEPALPGAAHHEVAYLVHLVGRDVEDVPAGDRGEVRRPPCRDGAVAENLKIDRGVRGRCDLLTDVAGVQIWLGFARPQAQEAEVDENKLTRRGGDGAELLDLRHGPGWHPGGRLPHSRARHRLRRLCVLAASPEDHGPTVSRPGSPPGLDQDTSRSLR
ncbi:MAG TPA: hypothetical protein VII22_17265, partial [Streptosporangiaceae bacterium]